MPSEVLPSSCSTLPPGFRFRPSEEELVGYFLKSKLCKISTAGVTIPELDLYKKEPSELAEMQTNYGTKDHYFFVQQTVVRTTPKGYWKCQKIDRLSKERGGESPIPALKSTFAYFEGQAPKGKATSWVLDEFRYMESNLDRLPTDYTICHLRNLKNKSDRDHMRWVKMGQRGSTAEKTKPENSRNSLVCIDILETTSSDSMASSCVTGVSTNLLDTCGHNNSHNYGYNGRNKHGNHHKRGHGSAKSHVGEHDGRHQVEEGSGDTSIMEDVKHGKEGKEWKSGKEGKKGKRGHRGFSKHFEKEGSPGKRTRSEVSCNGHSPSPASLPSRL